MLRLFGIPYMTAPMEAEAQCATLVSLNLVDGIITDDSDVFLFGGKRVFKNMFNQSKTVECFLLLDLSRELGLDRDTLVRLAYLLGSDYVEGLSGVGPVVAMELLREFPGEDGLVRFREWWMKVGVFINGFVFLVFGKLILRYLPLFRFNLGKIKKLIISPPSANVLYVICSILHF